MVGPQNKILNLSDHIMPKTFLEGDISIHWNITQPQKGREF